MSRLFRRLRDDRGASAYVEFLIIVVPFIALLFVMFEVSNISHTRMSMARGIQEGLIQTSMSPLSLDDPARWADFGNYVLSQGNAANQFSSVRFAASEAAYAAAVPERGEVVVLIQASSAKATAGSPISGPLGTTPAVSMGRPAASAAGEAPPVITAKAKYGYTYLTGFANLFYGWSGTGQKAPALLMESSMVSVDEHPDYEKGD